MTASRASFVRRDHVIAASLVGAVVVVVGYASGLGLKMTPAGTDSSLSAGGGPKAPAQVPVPQQQLPSDQPPPVGPMPPGSMPGPADPGAPPPVDLAPPLVTAVVDAPPAGQPEPGNPTPGSPTSTDPGQPPTSGTPLPPCQPGVVQPLLATVGGLPVVGDLTTGLGLTGPAGILTTLIGSCQLPDGQPLVPLTPAATLPAGG